MTTRKRQKPTTTSYDTQGELGQLLGEVSSTYGDKVVVKASMIPGFTHLPTNVFMLDYALLGGIAEGLASMIFGWESSGKTTLAMRIAAAAQAKYPNKAVMWIDAEQTFDPVWARAHGVDTDRLYWAVPEAGEHAVDILTGVLATDDTSLVILDSLPALVPQVEIDASAEDALVAARARLVSRMCAKILATWSEQRKRDNRVTVVIINQFRTKIGVYRGDPRVLPGGMQPKYLCTTMIEMKNRKEVMGRDADDIEIVDYNEHAFVIKKSKVGNSIKDGEFTLIRNPHHHLGFGTIDEAKQIVTYAKRLELITGGGSTWRVMDGETRFKNLNEIARMVEEDPDAATWLKQQIIMKRREEQGGARVPVDGYLLAPVPKSRR